MPDASIHPDWSRYAGLRVVRNLSEMIRRWYGLEISFADAQGYARAYPGQRVFEPSNEVCRLVLRTRDGFRQCTSDAAAAHGLVSIGARPAREKGVGTAPDPERRCHMGFVHVALPIEVNGRVIGSLLAGGIGGGESPEQVAARAAACGVDPEAATEAARRVPEVPAERREHLLELMTLVVREVARFHEELAEKQASIARLSDELQGKYAFGAILGGSRAMADVLSMVEKVVHSDSTVLVQGENGTGKELIARAIHYNSPRRDRPFVTQSAAAFHENLLESELFGHVKGAFTGAVKDKKGLFEMADGGSFFLDELGEMSPALQVKLLRVLQEGAFMPVGSTELKRVDVRMICATNRDLRRMVDRGEFREDLYYRINVINVHLPPLRERKEDIPVLVKHFLKRMAVERKQAVREVTQDVLDRFYDYEWPGNIRELENEIERLVVLTGDDLVIVPELLSTRIRERSMRANVRGIRVEKSLDEILEEVERRVLTEGLRKTRWNKTQLAKQLGISRKGLIAKVQRYQLDRRKLDR